MANQLLGMAKQCTGQLLSVREGFKVIISSPSLCTGMLKKCDQAGLEQCGKLWLLTGKKQKGEGRAGGTPRVASSAIHLWLEGIWGVYSIYIKTKDLATPWGVIYQDRDFSEKLHLMQNEDSLPWDRSGGVLYLWAESKKSNCLWSMWAASSWRQALKVCH